jgi:4-aminobutyrate aminotransferase / (S)-3-amino-2-methylpropionate transaminase / 5-aminovalerate transaminase
MPTKDDRWTRRPVSDGRAWSTLSLPGDLVNESQPKNQKPRIVTTVPGPKSRELRSREAEHLAPGVQNYAVTSGIVVREGRGSAVTDVDGNTFLDFIGGISVNGLGHSHPALVGALVDQVARVSVGSFTTEPRVELLERVAAHAPAPGVHRLQLYSSGAEAVESALRLAKSATGKYEFVSFHGGFHGKTLGVLGLMGSSFKNHLGPFAPGAHLLPYADCYRCPFGTTHPRCGLACVEYGRKQLSMESSGAIAAFIVEPMQGTAGNVIPPLDFLPAVRELADEFGALLIADEMITGFGRTGRFWGVEHSAVRPDIVTIGKTFGGGFPLTGVLTTDAIASSKPWSNPSGSSSSYGGNPLGAAAGAAALRIVDQEKLVDNARIVGEEMLANLHGFVDDFPFVGEVRGVGMLLAIELVADKSSRRPLSASACERVYQACIARGLLTMAYAPRVRLQPALTLDAATAANGLSILREVFTVARDQKWWEQA